MMSFLCCDDDCEPPAEMRRKKARDYDVILAFFVVG